MAKPATWTDLHEAARKALLNRAYEEAEGLLLQCCQEAEADGGTDHKEIAQILEQLAEAQWYQSKLRESEQTCERLLETAKAMRDPVVRVVCLSNLAIVNHTLNNWKEAEEFYLETLKEIRILLGPDHSYVTKYRSFYAEMLNQQNRQEEAKALGVQPREVTEFDWQTSKVVSMIQERLGNPGLSATALSSLVAVEMTREEYEMVYRSNSLRAKQAVSEGDLLLSEKLWAFNLKLIEKFKEPDEKLITALDNIAGMQYQQGRLKQSLVTFEKALTLKKKCLGKEDIAVARAMHFLAGVYYELNDTEKSISHLRASIKIYEKVLGKDHATVASALHNLGTIHHVIHQYEHAEKAYKKALDIKMRSLGPDNEETVRLTKSYAELLAKTGRAEEAKRLNPALSGYITGSWKEGDGPQ
ncbi:MAG: tetratricopeptide repeat protein [Candidatus Obscuribacterales bacterium]|nr:tetratricopeptide repeat protein [Candidatus Obscuribacterales bacterium]